MGIRPNTAVPAPQPPWVPLAIAVFTASCSTATEPVASPAWMASEANQPPTEGTAPEGTARKGTAPDGTAPEGTAPEGTAPEGTAPVTASNGSASNPGSVPGPSPIQVTWQDGHIRVFGSSGRLLWSLPDRNFLEVARGSESVDSDRGCFVFQDRVHERCGGAEVTSLETGPTWASVRGVLRQCHEPFELRFDGTSPRQVAFSAGVRTSRPKPFNRLALSWDSTPDEKFFGFGHQYGPLNMKGRRLPIWSGEQGIGRGAQPLSATISLVSGGCDGDWSTTYTAVPATLTNQGHGIVLENTEYLAFDFRHGPWARVDVWSSELRGRLLDAPTPLEGITSLTEYTGRMGPLPEWTQTGVLLRSRGGSQEARAALRKALAAGAKVSALWLEDWGGERETPFGYRMLWNWDVDRTLYPDWEALLTEFRSQGVRVLTYFNPFLADPEGWPGTRRNLYAEAKAQGFLVQRSNGSVYPVGNGGFQAGLMDLTSPGARTLLKDIMKRQLSLGVSGWMADFGEALPYDARLASGVPASTFHNQYPLQWAKLNREALQEAGLEDDAIFFSRSGNARSPAYSKAFWIGDQNTTWDDKDGIKTVIPALLSGGMSGYSLNHMDVGGWLSLTIPLVHFTRSKELMQRWLELGAFGALYRLHHTNRPSQNWQWDSDQETLELFARMSRLYAALGPYRMELMNDARDKGWPLLRHLWLHFPDDPEVLGLERQMMFGSELLVAPALESRKATVRVYLPAGDWVLSWDGASYGSPMAGRWVTVPAPLGQPPIFYRRGSLQGEALVTRLRNEGLLR